MTSDELLPLRELAEIHEREGRFADASCIRLLFLEIDRLTQRVAELDAALRSCKDDCEWVRICDVPKMVDRILVQKTDGSVEVHECK